MRGVGLGTRAVLAAVVVALGAGVVPVRATAGVESPAEPFRPCTAAPMPFAGTAGSQLSLRELTSKDAVPVRYQLWSGTVPSFDGTPLSVDVTVPCEPAAPGEAGADAPLPTVTMLHGFTDDKTVWEETGKSDTVLSKDRPGANSRWNNIWFASRGYATLTYTARGWRDSCGPQTPAASKAACAAHEGWIHLDDKRWEVRDAQWLTSALVQSGVADARRLAITGGSYGGAPTASAALLDGHVMCGGAAVPKALGVDPCAGEADGERVPWTTPDGTTRLSWAAALPLYTFSDLLRVLAPNGRWSDGAVHPPAEEDSTEPFGVPLASTVSGLVLAGQAFGTFAPRGSDLDSDILTTTERLLAGPPYRHADPIVAAGTQTYQRFKSPITEPVNGSVPIFWVQGLTDALFPATEALAFAQHAASEGGSPHVKVFLGDIGHDYAAERQDDWDAAKAQMNAFLDHYLRPDRTPTPPVFDVSASVTRCLPPNQQQEVVQAATWDRLHDDVVTFGSDDAKRTSTARPGPSGEATDPISTATLPGPHSYKGCRIRRPAAIDETTATYDFPIERELLLLGAPTVALTARTQAASVPLAVRMWDVTADGRTEALVTRGVYRTEGAMGDGRELRFQVWPQAYRFRAGHTLRVEVTGNDAPYLLANRVRSTVRIGEIEVRLPIHREVTASNGSGRPGLGSKDGSMDGEWLPLAVFAGIVVILVVLVGGVLTFGIVTAGRSSRRQRPPW